MKVGHERAVRSQSEPPRAAAVAASGGNSPGRPLPKRSGESSWLRVGWALRRGSGPRARGGGGEGAGAGAAQAQSVPRLSNMAELPPLPLLLLQGKC